MYYLTIETKHNVIHLIVDDVTSEDVQEILEQPWVISYTCEANVKNKEQYKKLVRIKEKQE